MLRLNNILNEWFTGRHENKQTNHKPSKSIRNNVGSSSELESRHGCAGGSPPVPARPSQRQPCASPVPAQPRPSPGPAPARPSRFQPVPASPSQTQPVPEVLGLVPGQSRLVLCWDSPSSCQHPVPRAPASPKVPTCCLDCA